MDFRQLEIFVSVYRLRNFSRAGEALFLSQPTISNQISCLEDELGVKLFDRTSRQIIPTESAKTFYGYALKMLDLRERASFALSKNKEIEGRLEIAASTIPSQYLLPGPMKSFQEKYPNVSFLMNKGDTEEVTKGLLEMKYEIGIVGARMDENNLVYQKLTQDKLVLITQNTDEEIDDKVEGDNAEGDRFGVDKVEADRVERGKVEGAVPGGSVKERKISLESLLHKKFIVREPGSGTRLTFEMALKEKGIDPDVLHKVAEMNYLESIKQAVREGLGVSVVSSLSVEDYLKFGWVKAYTVEGLNLERDFYLITQKNRTLSPCAAEFQRHILEYYKK
ncbi:MAG: LysR family transcriptional regulator [Desulfitobacterium sp.]|nr:LysR family transcriptional regulator [Desulfitobacterium sp.]